MVKWVDFYQTYSMTPAEAPKSNFEKIITHEVGNLGEVDSLSLEGASEKISEVVGENASEQITTKGSTKAQSQTQAGDDTVVTTQMPQGLVLPTPNKQKAELHKAITKRTNHLVKEVTKMQRSKNYSPAKMEATIVEIRHLRKILSELVNATIERLEDLYRRYIWRS